MWEGVFKNQQTAVFIEVMNEFMYIRLYLWKWLTSHVLSITTYDIDLQK